MLQLYLDTAIRTEAEPLLKAGLFRGLTTNPLLLHRAALNTADLPDLYDWATSAGAQEVFLQAWGQDDEALIKCAENLRAIGPNVVVKLPVTREGVRAAVSLVRHGHPVLLTAVYNAQQALLGAAAGAHYVAPYLGRMHDAGRQAPAEIIAMQRALRAVGSQTKILVASLRSLRDLVALAQEGLSRFALSPTVSQDFFAEPLTEEIVQAFDRVTREMEG